MKLISKNFKYLILILIFLLLLSFRLGQVEVISFSIDDFNDNTAKEYNFSDGKYKVGKEINPGFYDIYIIEDSNINGIDYKKDQTYNNYILNKRDLFILEGEVFIKPAKSIYWNSRDQRGTYLIKEDGIYNFELLSPDESSSVDIEVNGELVTEIEENNPSQEVALKKGEVMNIRLNKQTKFKVEENEE